MPVDETAKIEFKDDFYSLDEVTIRLYTTHSVPLPEKLQSLWSLASKLKSSMHVEGARMWFVCLIFPEGRS